MSESKVKVVKVSQKPCKPFILEVMVFSPEAGYKFQLMVERQCASATEPIWKLVFDLEKKIENEFVQIVHVSFTSGSVEESDGIKSMVTEGISYEAAKVVVGEVYPATKAIEEDPGPSEEKKKELRDSMRKVTKTQLVSLGL
jgi:hypothetical protein